MKRITAGVMLALLCFGVQAFWAAEGGKDMKDKHQVKGDIPFSYSYDETLKACKENGKPMFVYFTYEG